MECSNYDYNGIIFVFGRVDSSITPDWANVTKVMMSIDSSSNFVYSADIKEIPYTQKTNFDGSDCVNNTACKIFNINTFTHRASENIKYQFSSGTHTCYLRFFYTSTDYAQTSVTLVVHASLSTPTITVDEENGIVNVERSSKYGSPRYYIEVRRKDRNKVNQMISWQDKDYIHAVIMKGIEGGKYNEGIPHTGLMPRSNESIAGSKLKTGTLIQKYADKSSKNNDIMLLSSAENEIAEVTCDTDIPFTSTKGVSKQHFVFAAPATAVYHFTQENGPDLCCYLYSDSDFTDMLTYHDDIGDGNNSFSLFYSMSKGQVVYIEIYDYSKNGETINLRINTTTTQSVTSFSPCTIAPHSAIQLSYYSNSDGYITLYPAKKAAGLVVSEALTNGSKTPYYTLTVSSGTNKYGVYNSSSEAITYWLTDLHSGIDYQPYWRVNPINKFNACVVFDNAEIEEEYGKYCIAQVADALSRLANIISETSGNMITFKITNKGVSKLYVTETINASSQAGRYVNGSNKIVSDGSSTLYYATVSKDSIYRVNYEHGGLYYAKYISTSTLVTKISADSSYLWYEDIGGNYGADENTLIVKNNASGYYVISNSMFSLEKVASSSECSQAYHDEYAYDYNITIRFGLDGTTWMGNQGVATSHNGGYSADTNGQGQWINWLYHDSKYGVEWSYAIINVDNSDLFETICHVIHEEIGQSLGIGDDCYSHEESIHWDPEYANPDWYTGIDRTILDFAYNSDKNGYTQFDLCNEYDLPIILFREYSEYNSGAGSYQFRLKDAAGNWLLRSGEYDVYSWCAGIGTDGGSIAGSGNDGWDDAPYSLRSAAVSFTVQGGWYWLDYGIDMKNGSKKLKVSDVSYTVWNSFVDAVADVMGSGTIPNDSANYGSAANLSFSDGITRAKLTDTDKILYAQKFNIINYIINAKVPTGIEIQKSLTSQVFAEHMEKLQDCRNLM